MDGFLLHAHSRRRLTRLQTVARSHANTTVVERVLYTVDDEYLPGI